MTLTSQQRAILTARASAARAGAVRAGFTPTYTVGLTPGSVGPFVPARKQPFTAQTWTAVKR